MAILMAYSVPLNRSCGQPGCDRRATVEVRNNGNETVGQFCRRHGDAWVATLTAQEQAS